MKIPKLTNTQYDMLKKFLLLVVPGMSTLIVGLGVIYGFGTDKIVGTIALLATFAGIVLNFIAGKFEKEQ